MSIVSRILRQAREQQGITLAEVSSRTYIKLPYLEALEAGHTEVLPAAVYVHGYIRQYAKLLGLDGSALVLQYQQQAQDAETPAPLVLKGERGTPLLARPEPVRATRTVSMPLPPRMVAPLAPVTQTLVKEEPGQNLPNLTTTFIHDLPATPAEPPSQILAQEEANALKAAAQRYADQVLAQLEAEIHRTLQTIRNGRSFIQDRMAEPRSA